MILALCHKQRGSVPLNKKERDMPIFVNGTFVKTFNFSGGECHLNLSNLELSDNTKIISYLNNSDDIMCLLLAVDAIRRVRAHTKINLTIPYFPYARQDRVCNTGEPLSVKVMANLINMLKCNKVVVYDPHSEVTPALLNNCEVISMADILLETNFYQHIIDKNLTFISPDAGAEKKVRETAKRFSQSTHKIDLICATKIRETSTGNIIATEIHGDFNKKDVIILDDICDGGRTFIELAKTLNERGSGDIYLYVTHGIFSKGLSVLKENFKHIYCYHSMLIEKEIDSDFVSILGTNIFK